MFLCCLLLFSRVFLLLVLRHCWRFSWARKCFLVKEPCNRITLHMCFGLESQSVCVHVLCGLLREFHCSRITHTYTYTQRHSSALYFWTCVWSSYGESAYVLTFCAYTHEHVCKCLCLQMPWGAHAPLGFWALQSTASCYSEGPGELCCAVTEQLWGGVWWGVGVGVGAGDFLCCPGCSGWTAVSSVGLQLSAAHSPGAVILPLQSARAVTLKYKLQMDMHACMRAVNIIYISRIQ